MANDLAHCNVLLLLLLLYGKRIIRRKVDLNAVGEVLRPLRIWSSLPNLARATLLNTARAAAGEVARRRARERGGGGHTRAQNT